MTDQDIVFVLRVGENVALPVRWPAIEQHRDAKSWWVHTPGGALLVNPIARTKLAIELHSDDPAGIGRWRRAICDTSEPLRPVELLRVRKREDGLVDVDLSVQINICECSEVTLTLPAHSVVNEGRGHWVAPYFEIIDACKKHRGWYLSPPRFAWPGATIIDDWLRAKFRELARQSY